PRSRVPTPCGAYRKEGWGGTYRLIDAEVGDDGAPLEPPYRPGSREDFDRLYCATYQRVFGTLLGLLRDRAAAEDCAQEAFLRAFRAWSRWRPDAPAEAWVHRIAINVAVSFHRRERLREAGQLITRLGPPHETDPAEGLMTSALLHEGGRLPRPPAAAARLRYLPR